MACAGVRARSPLAAVVLLAVAHSAIAQGDLDEQTVINRDRQGLDPVGVSIGSFKFFPSISLAGDSNDNIFATSEAQSSDHIYVLTPTVEIRSDWSRNALGAGAESSLHRYSSFATEDHTDARAFVNGRWDTARNGFFSAEYDTSTNHEDRSAADDAGGDSPTKFSRDDLTISYRVAPGRMFARASIVSRTLDYEDVARGAEIVNNDDRDRDQLTVAAQVGYQLSDSYGIYLERRQRSFSYDELIDDLGFNRNGSGHETVVGATFNVSEIMFGDVFLGSKSQDFHDQRFSDIGGSAYGANLAWNVTQLTTLSFQASREVEPTTVDFASGVDASRYSFGVDHELLRNLIVSVDWGSEELVFKGIGREDDNGTVALTARYLMNRRMEVRFSYLDQDRDSQAEANLEFSRKVIGIEIIGQL